MKKIITTTLIAGLATCALATEPASNNKQIVEGSRVAMRTASTLWGSTGLIFVPTAYTIGPKEFNFNMAISKDFSSATANYGLIKDVEVGFAYLARDGQEDRALANAKVHIIPSNFKNFELGIGVMDAVGAIDQTFYVVGSFDVITPDYAAKKGAAGLRLHAGVGTGYFSEKPFGGAELFFDRGFSLVGEWDTKNVNFAARYAHDEHFFLELGNYSTRPMVKMTYNMRF